MIGIVRLLIEDWVGIFTLVKVVGESRGDWGFSSHFLVGGGGLPRGFGARLCGVYICK